MIEIKTKNFMYCLLKLKKFGNTFQIWNSLEEWKKRNSESELFGIRCVNCYNGPFITDLPPDELEKYAIYFAEKGYSIVLYETSPKHLITIQGEVSKRRYTHDWELEYSTKKEHMRKALSLERKSLKGLEAEYLIRKYFNENSFEDLLMVMDEFPDHVIEFTAYNKCVGVCQARNVVIWECRLY